MSHPISNTDENSLEIQEKYLEFKSINYVGLIPHLINSIQEQQAQIEDLKETNRQLMATNESLQQSLLLIETALGMGDRNTEPMVLTDVKSIQTQDSPIYSKPKP